MYKSLTKKDIQRVLKLSPKYKVDGLIVIGTHPKTKEHSCFCEALKNLNLHYIEEKIEDSFFSDIKSFKINNKRIWFDVVYGAAYLSEVIHVACILGSKANILLGCCGGLIKEMETGQIVLPKASYGNESTTRMYQKENKSFVYSADENLRMKIKKQLNVEGHIYEENLITVQAMFGETNEDIENWAANGYCGVDMESATLFAVSKHFNVPAVALLYVADNLIKKELVTDDSYKAKKELRWKIKKENYEIAIRTILDIDNVASRRYN